MARAYLPVFYPAWFLDPAPPLDCARTVKEAGFDGVSFLVGNVDDPRRLDRLTDSEAGALRAGLARMALGCSLHVWTDTYLGLPRPDACALLCEQVEACVCALSDARLPALNVTLDPPVRFADGSARLDVDVTRELVAFLAALKHRYNVRPGLENWPYRCIGTPEALRDALWSGGGHVGVLLDTGHAHIALSRGWCEQSDMTQFVRELAGPIVEVHLHDNGGLRDEHLMPGEGTAPLHASLEATLVTGFRGPITVECDLAAEGRPGLAAGLSKIRQTYHLG